MGCTVTISGTGADADHPSISMNASGDAIVVWERICANFSNVVQAASYTILGGWDSPVDLSDDTEESFSAKIAMNSSGNAVAIWAHHNGNEYEVVASTFFSSTWGTPGVISNSGEDSFYSKVVMNNANQAIAVWKHLMGLISKFRKPPFPVELGLHPSPYLLP